MNIHWDLVIFVLFLLDSVSAVLMSWFGRGWWTKHLSFMAEYFPPAKGWSLLYLLAVIIIGRLLGVI